jgi:DHHC palmitoyltransferase
MHHCRVCDRCCVKFDHHCGMAINCIGINNYQLFFLFLVTTQLHLIVSLIVNLANLYASWANYTWGGVFMCVVLALHNLGTWYYNFQLSKWYLSMAGRNMHAVEEANIGQLFDKARFHKMVEGLDKTKFYYTRQGGWFENFSEMLGTRFVPRWFLPLPHYNR